MKKTKKTRLPQLAVKVLVGSLTLLGLNSCVSKKVVEQMKTELQQRDAQIGAMQSELDLMRSELAKREAQLSELRKREDMGRQKLLYGGPNREFRKVEE